MTCAHLDVTVTVPPFFHKISALRESPKPLFNLDHDSKAQAESMAKEHCYSRLARMFWRRLAIQIACQ